MPHPRHLDLIGRPQNLRIALAFARHIAKANRRPQKMPVIAAGQRPHDLAIAHHRLVVEQQGLGVAQPELHQTTLHPHLGPAQHRLAPDEFRLGGFHRKPQTRLQHMILISDVMAKMPVSLFDPAGIQGMQPAQGHHAGGLQCLEHMRGLIGADI